MAVGLNPVIANQILMSLFTNAAFVQPAASYIQLHTGDPGVNGTANISSYATRTQITTWGTAAGGVLAITGPIAITASWSGTNGESVTYVSYWSALTGGTFVTSDQLTAPVGPIATGAAVNLPTLTAVIPSLAA